jgi:hypothetical protein
VRVWAREENVAAARALLGNDEASDALALLAARCERIVVVGAEPGVLNDVWQATPDDCEFGGIVAPAGLPSLGTLTGLAL